jgi:glycosyltransferase domain-containing protein
MISILIPTMNRSAYINRALSYYARTGFKGQVLIGDSSNDQHAAAIRQTIQSVRDRLDVRYSYFPNPPFKGNAVVMRDLANQATTPYIVYAGDDDFVVPDALERCAAFLDQNPGYGAAHAAFVVVRPQQDGPYGPLAEAFFVPGHIINSDSACERWRGYIRHAVSNQYYLHRTEIWRRMYRDVATIPMRYLGEEVLPCSLGAIMGKVKTLEGLSCVFQVNAVRQFGWSTHSMYSLMMQENPDWSINANRLRDLITEALVEQDHISPDEARRVFDKEWWRHVLIMAQAHYDSWYEEPSNIFTAFKKRYAWIVRLNQAARQIREGRHRHVTLPLLLNPSSPLHNDFMPIYQTITGGPITAGAPAGASWRLPAIH